MAATFRCFGTTPIQCFSSSSSSANRSKSADPSSSKQASGSNWWAPLFGPNFISGSVPTETDEMKIQPAAAEEIPFQRLNLEVDRGRSKFRPGCFTEEKAVELRKVTIQTSTFHDKMYHSAIASRLASDVSGSRVR